MKTLSVIIPAYNEENGIAEIARRVLAAKEALAQRGIDLAELLVVDDGSGDNTAGIAASMDGITLIRHPHNQGYGAALKTGFREAKSEFVGFLDADGTYPPEFFPELCEAALDGAELVIGSRMAGAESQMPITRRLGNLFFANLLSVLARRKVSDSASGMRVFRRDILQRIYPLPDGLNLTPVMSTRALHEGVRMVEVPIPYSERMGRSKLSVVRDGSVFLHSMVWTALTYNPVRILGLLGFAGIGLALAISIALISARLQGNITLVPWQVASLFIGAVAGFCGVSLFALGTTFNYLVALFYKEPIRQGLFGRPLFKTPVDQHFWWMGGLAVLAGLIAGVGSLVLGLNGWQIGRLWLYMLGSAMFILLGVQLTIYWIVLRVLDELSHRRLVVERELETVPVRPSTSVNQPLPSASEAVHV